MTVNRFGPFTVLGAPSATRIAVRAGETIQTLPRGIVGFGGGIGGWLEPNLTADGDPVTAPPDYPAPPLRKNSLICEIGGRFFQGGTNSTFISNRDGELSLLANDRYPADNHGGWQVTVVQTTVDGPTTGNVPRLSVASVEAVQVVQNRAGQVPLVPGKRTMLRIFFSSGLGATVNVGAGPGRLGPVDGVVTVRSGTRSRALSFRAGVALAPGTHRRDDATHSVQLEVPLDLLIGPIQVDVSATVRGHAATETAFTTTSSRSFDVTTNRRETVLPIRLRNTRGGMPAPPVADYTALLRGSISMLPIPESGPTVNPSITWDASSLIRSEPAPSS